MGYAIDNQELADAMYAVAVPIWDRTGRFYAALAVHGPVDRFNPDVAFASLDPLKRSAGRIAELMF